MEVAISSLNSWLYKSDISYEYYEVTEQFYNRTHRYLSVPYERVRWVAIQADEAYFKVLVSAHYNVSLNKLREIFDVKKINILTSHADFPAQFDRVFVDKGLLNFTAVLLESMEASNDRYIKVCPRTIKQVTNASTLDCNFLPRYKAKVSSVSPVSRRESFEHCTHPFFGISLENSNFVRSKLLASLDWIAKRFDTCTVLIGDSIHRITLQTNQGMTPDEASVHALKLGQKFIEDESACFKQYAQQCEFTFVLCSEVQKTARYHEHHDYLQTLYHADESFQLSVRQFGESYHSQRKAHVSEEVWRACIDSSSAYFLEEFAIFACLQEKSKDVMIYPGSFSTLAEIANGDHPLAPEALKALTVVSLQLKKR